MVGLAVLGLLPLLTGPAQAEALAWAWDPGTPVRYVTQTAIGTPLGWGWTGLGSQSARTATLGYTTTSSCVGHAKGKDWVVVCTIESSEWAAKTHADERNPGATAALLAAWPAMVQGAQVEITLRPDGRFKRFDVSGTHIADSRAAYLRRALVTLLRAAFAPLDVQLPPEDQPAGKPWRHKGSPSALSVVGIDAPQAVARWSYIAAGGGGEPVVFHGSGRGTTAAQPSGSMVDLHIALQGGGRFAFSEADHRLVYGEVWTAGEVSGAPAGGDGPFYDYGASIALLAADGTPTPPPPR
jgi:hypothetical protein